ncbi:hypothetical protein ACFYRC_05970 [Streptomyces sp. NPDC005279]|uniref:hypothetical protein n=1 Tax=Streptomyces sp. NPDC005279 TaxID=3364712 RepID=UPI0036B477AC
MSDFVRDLLASGRAAQRARSDSAYVSALLNGQPLPSPEAFNACVDAGLSGEAALAAARELDQSATRFFRGPDQPDDQPPRVANDHVRDLFAAYQQRTGSQQSRDRMVHDDQPPPAA